MDPLCHTLVGATLAQAGLKRRTSYATATLVLAANAPDVDAVTYLTGNALFWRRGWTHGLLALLIWPIAVAGVILLWNAVMRRVRRRAQPAPRPRAVLALATAGVLTHPALDYLNNYGLRWLMPFANRWFYGDALFIVDPWIWSVLALGSFGSWYLARAGHRHPTRPARVAVAVSVVYVLLMFGLARVAPPLVGQQFAARGIRLVRPPMVAPVFADPTTRYTIADDGTRYYVAACHVWPSFRVAQGMRVILRNDTHPAIRVARTLPEAAGFFGWARFPFFSVTEDGDAFVVRMEDARYAPIRGSSWSALEVRVPKAAVARTVPVPGRSRESASLAGSTARPLGSGVASPQQAY